jgi:hypothetical protein
MKLTKGKINRLYKKKRQSLKKIKNKNKIKNKSKRHTFRKHKKLNLARKSLKKFRGGAYEDVEVRIIEKPFNSTPGSIQQTAYIVDSDGKLQLPPVQVTNPSPAPVTNPPPAPVTNYSPAPVTKSSPAPVTNYSPAPMTGNVVINGKVVDLQPDEARKLQTGEASKLQTGVVINPTPTNPTPTNPTTTNPTPTNPMTNSLSGKSDRDVAVAVVNQIYREMNQGPQDPSKALKEFSNKMAANLTSELPQITGPNAVDPGNMQIVVRDKNG